MLKWFCCDLCRSWRRLVEERVLLGQRLVEALVAIVRGLVEVAEVLVWVGVLISVVLVELALGGQDVKLQDVMQALTGRHQDLLDAVTCPTLSAFQPLVFPWELVLIQSSVVHLGRCGWCHFCTYRPLEWHCLSPL